MGNLLPLTVLLRLECRGRRDTRTKYFENQVTKPADATLESLTLFVLEKSGEAFGAAYVKRTRLQVEQYDPQERVLLVSHSLPQSSASDFILDLEWGFGFKEKEIKALPRQ